MSDKKVIEAWGRFNEDGTLARFYGFEHVHNWDESGPPLAAL